MSVEFGSREILSLITVINTTEDFLVIVLKATASWNYPMETSSAENGLKNKLLTRLKLDIPMVKSTTELFKTLKNMGRAICF